MEVKTFNEALREYDNDFLLGAYYELKYLPETGSFPPGQKYFRELVDLRAKLYSCYRDNNSTRKDLMDEIARRWAAEHES